MLSELAEGSHLTPQVGVKIAVPCAPTVEGIRAGRDEVLDCALKALSDSGEQAELRGKNQWCLSQLPNPWVSQTK